MNEDPALDGYTGSDEVKNLRKHIEELEEKNAKLILIPEMILYKIDNPNLREFDDRCANEIVEKFKQLENSGNEIFERLQQVIAERDKLREENEKLLLEIKGLIGQHDSSDQ